MSPLPWPLMRRRDPYQGVTAPPVRLYERSPVRVVTGPPPAPVLPPTADEEHPKMRRAYAWLRREEDVVLARLAALTDRYGPWTAAVRLFTDEEGR